MSQTLIHYGIHFGLPLLIAIIAFKSYWKYAYFIMLLGLTIDLDHLLADPIFNPNRCSINFHPLHSYYAILVYLLMILPKKTRLLGIGLLVHILADAIDCWLM